MIIDLWEKNTHTELFSGKYGCCRRPLRKEIKFSINTLSKNFFKLYYLFHVLGQAVCSMHSQPGIEPEPPALDVQSLNPLDHQGKSMSKIIFVFVQHHLQACIVTHVQSVCILFDSPLVFFMHSLFSITYKNIPSYRTLNYSPKNLSSTQTT